jgi:putative glutamate/gamma-aminobutyrate antiporter
MQHKTSVSSRRVLTVFVLAMINVAAIASLRNLPMMADCGFALVFFLTVAAVTFFIPTALVSAELATGWPKTGGVYVWVKEALGRRCGFLAIWLQWINSVFWYPTVLAFTAGTLAYVANPALANNKLYMLLVVLVVFWAATFANFHSMKASGLISTVGVIAGTIAPAALIIILGIVWLCRGEASQISFSAANLVPDMSNISNIVFLAGMFLALGGMEMSAAHAQEVKNPQRDYPRAIFLSAAVIILIFILGSLAIAIVIPQKDISLVAGVMEAFAKFLGTYNLGWAIPIIAPLIAVGAIASVSTWIVGPTKGLLATSRHGDLPPFFQKVNRAGMPTNLLLIQAVIVTFISLVFLLMPTVSSSFWILTALTTLLYLIMYVLMFVSAIRLRYSAPDVPRSYRIPGGNLGMWLVGGIGILSSLFAFVIGFFPPAQVEVGNIFFFEAFLILGVLIVCAVPLVICHFSKPGWALQQPADQEEELES